MLYAAEWTADRLQNVPTNDLVVNEMFRGNEEFRVRYRAERHEIAERYAEWEIASPSWNGSTALTAVSCAGVLVSVSVAMFERGNERRSGDE